MIKRYKYPTLRYVYIKLDGQAIKNTMPTKNRSLRKKRKMYHKYYS